MWSNFVNKCLFLPFLTNSGHPIEALYLAAILDKVLPSLGALDHKKAFVFDPTLPQRPFVYWLLERYACEGVSDFR